MAVVANLTDAATTVTTGKEAVVIVDNFQSKRGGATLDVAAFISANAAVTTLQPGHVIIQETATGNLKPMPISGSAFAALPAGHTYYGIQINPCLVTRPFAGILLRGTVNPNAMPYTVTSILTALKAALPLIDFRAD